MRISQLKSSKIIKIIGLVQGVGFRPFVFRLAQKHLIAGWVENNNEGVTIKAEGFHENIQQFIEDLKNNAPQASHIEKIIQQETSIENIASFEIRNSSQLSNAITQVSPDIAVCNECLSEMSTQAHRLAYPFINCTNCGPRFTIIKQLPYDRHLTTMQPFEMCPVCNTEYEDIYDRRFHAQPIACNDCGPVYNIHSKENKQFETKNVAEIIAQTIDDGGLVALKGMGGYHLICDATNEKTVQNLRFIKHREGKPLAVMVQNTASLKGRFILGKAEETDLVSWQRPIVLLQNVQPFSPSVSNGMHTTGVMLPYMPLHYQLFNHLKTDAIVFTSGNLSNTPVLISDPEAIAEFIPVTDLVVTYNREIYNRADDSVVFVVNDKTRLLRRARAFVPSPIHLKMNSEGIFAAGSELVNTFAIGKGTQAILSQHIGDLKNAETLDFYEESVVRFSNLFQFKPTLVACDMHPDYLSSQFARSLGIEIVEIQHHHAHIASCMVENGLDEAVIGIAFDGTGYGDDDSIWGGEFFVCDLEQYDRKFYFDPVPLPGGDKVTLEPWRMAVSYLYKYFGKSVLNETLFPFSKIMDEDLLVLLKAIDLNINSPLSSGAGRLFDAVAALTGVCLNASFHAEAPMRLEAIAAQNCRGKYIFDIEGQRIVFWKLFYLLLKDLKHKVAISEISAKFHNTMVVLILTVARKIKTETAINKVVLSGGTFQNRYLLENCEIILKKAGFEVFTHHKVPSNDGGIALGQLAIAAKKRESKSSRI